MAKVPVGSGSLILGQVAAPADRVRDVIGRA
jgi:hypothetical protein